MTDFGFFSIVMALGVSWLSADLPVHSDGGPILTSSASRSFMIPFELDGVAEFQYLVLYASEDNGKTWTVVTVGRPIDRGFPVSLTRDGNYSFAVQGVDESGRLHPGTTRDLDARIKILVKTPSLDDLLRTLQVPDATVPVKTPSLDDLLRTLEPPDAASPVKTPSLDDPLRTLEFEPLDATAPVAGPS